MHENVKRNFILQQGFAEPQPRSCGPHYSALLFQPRLISAIVVAAVVLQSWTVFLALAAVLWWSALWPRWNPFDALYNATLGDRPGAVRLASAPAPRRFAQGMAGGFALGIAVCLRLEWSLAAYILQGVFLAALIALGFGAFCLGSFVFHLLSGRAAFARRTVPWARREAKQDELIAQEAGDS